MESLYELLKESRKYSSYAAAIGYVKEGLTPKEELKLLAERFGMSTTETIEKVIHEVYISGIGLSELKGVLDRAFAYLDALQDYNGDDGSTIVEEEEEFEPAF